MRKNEFMNDREYRAYKRAIRKRRAIRNKILTAFCLITIVLFASISVYSISSAHAANEEVKFKYYTKIEVAKEDTLWSIADRYMDSDKYKSKSKYIDEVKSINHIKDDKIVAGATIIVPYYSTNFQ